MPVISCEFGFEAHPHEDDVHWNAGLVEEADAHDNPDKLFEVQCRMLAHARKHFPADDPCILHVLLDLSYTSIAKSRYGESIPYATEALSLLERSAGKEHPCHLALCIIIACGYRELQNPAGKVYLQNGLSTAKALGADEKSIRLVEHQLDNYDDYRFDQDQWQERASRYSEANPAETRTTISRLSKLIECDSSDWLSVYFRGSKYFTLGEEDLALSDFNEVIELCPDEPCGYSAKARVLRSLKQYEDALVQITLAIERKSDPNGKGPAKKPVGADYNYALENENQWRYLLTERASINEILNRTADAIQDLNTLLDAPEGRELLWFFNTRADLHEKLGNLALAEADRETYARLSRELHERVEKNKSAEPKGDVWGPLIGQRSVCEFKPGLVHFSNVEKALDEVRRYTHVIDAMPDDANAFFHRAHAYSYTGDRFAAINDFRRLVELQPKFPDGYIELAKLFLATNQYAEVIPVVGEKLLHCGQDGDSLLLRAEAHEGLGQLDRALEDMDSAFPLLTSWGKYGFKEKRGYLLEKMGKLDLAAVDKQLLVDEELTKKDRLDLRANAPQMAIRHWAFMNLEGELHLTPHIDTCNVFSEGLASARRQDGFMTGYLDMTMKWAIRPQFGSAGMFCDGLACVSFGPFSTGRLSGFINKAGDVVIAPKYATAFSFRNGYCIVYLPKIGAARSMGLIDTGGVEVIPPEYDDVNQFCGDLARVKKNDKYGYYNKAGVCVVHPQFTDAGDLCKDRAPVKVSDQWGFIDGSGKMVIEPQFSEASQFLCGLSIVTTTQGGTGAINVDGKFAIEPRFQSMGGFSEELAFALVDDKFAIIDKDGSIIGTPEFDNVNWFTRGMAAVEIGGKWGFVDATGGIILAPQFDEVREPFWRSDGVAVAVRSDDKWGFVLRGSHRVITPQFDEVRDFYEGLAAVRIGEKAGGKWGFINVEGIFVCFPRFDYVSNVYEGLAQVGSFDGL